MNALIKQLTAPILTVFISLVLLYTFTTLFGPIPFSVRSTPADLFTVNGVGEEAATPDSAQFTVGVTKTATTVEAAQEQVNTITNAIINQLKAQGIEEKDIKTQNYSSYPVYGEMSASSRSMGLSVAAPDGGNVTGYTVSQDLVVTANSIEIAEKALDAAVASGANQIAGVSFVINDEDKKTLQQKARKKAIENAKAKAQELAKDSGIRLGKIVNIYVAEDQAIPMMYDRKLMNAELEVAAAPTNLQPGENTVVVNVTLSYETR